MALDILSIVSFIAFVFVAGHALGYHRGRGKATCPLCDGKGYVEGKAPTISNERETFDAGFQAGLCEGRGTFRDANPIEKRP